MKKKMEEMNLRINLQEEIKENEYNKKLKKKEKDKNAYVEDKLDKDERAMSKEKLLFESESNS